MPEQLQLRLEWQRNPVADDVSALTAVVRPILKGVLFALRKEVVAEVGGYENVKLMMLPRLTGPATATVESVLSMLSTMQSAVMTLRSWGGSPMPCIVVGSLAPNPHPFCSEQRKPALCRSFTQPKTS